MLDGRADQRNQHFHRIAIQEDPRHLGKRLAQQRQFERGAGVELDEVAFFGTGPPLTQRAHHPLQPRRFAARRGASGARRWARASASIGPASETTTFSGSDGQHLRHHRGAAARHMEDKARGLHAGASLRPFGQRRHGRVMPKQTVEGGLQGELDGAVEKRVREPFATQVTPFHQGFGSLPEQPDRHPTIQRKPLIGGSTVPASRGGWHSPRRASPAPRVRSRAPARAPAPFRKVPPRRAPPAIAPAARHR